MTNLQINTLAKNSELRKIIESSIVVAAVKISGENPGAVTPNLTEVQARKRHAKATSVLANSQLQAPSFAYAAASQPGLNSVITINTDGSLTYTGSNPQGLDGDVDYIIESIWDDLSGVSYEDLQTV